MSRKKHSLNRYSEKTIKRMRKELKRRVLAYEKSMVDSRIDEIIEQMRDIRFTTKDNFILYFTTEFSGGVVLGLLEEFKTKKR